MSALVNAAGVVADDPWRLVGDDDEAGAGDIVVSFQRFKAERGVLAARDGRLGLRIAPADKVEEIADQLGGVALVEVEFPAFRDGRGYSTARLLRDRYNYAGELRAVGDVLEDQVFYMLRCGFDSFTLKGEDAVAAFERARGSFAISYQTASDGRGPIHALRAKGRAARASVE